MKNNVTIVNPMQENKILWTSKNGRWTIEQLPTGHIIVGDNHYLWNDNPFKRDDGVIAYDFPERVPKYVKRKVAQIMGGTAL